MTAMRLRCPLTTNSRGDVDHAAEFAGFADLIPTWRTAHRYGKCFC